MTLVRGSSGWGKNARHVNVYRPADNRNEGVSYESRCKDYLTDARAVPWADDWRIYSDRQTAWVVPHLHPPGLPTATWIAKAMSLHCRQEEIGLHIVAR